jgi:hypothetical protein
MRAEQGCPIPGPLWNIHADILTPLSGMTKDPMRSPCLENGQEKRAHMVTTKAVSGKQRSWRTPHVACGTRGEASEKCAREAVHAR